MHRPCANGASRAGTPSRQAHRLARVVRTAPFRVETALRVMCVRARAAVCASIDRRCGSRRARAAVSHQPDRAGRRLDVLHGACRTVGWGSAPCADAPVCADLRPLRVLRQRPRSVPLLSGCGGVAGRRSRAKAARAAGLYYDSNEARRRASVAAASTNDSQWVQVRCAALPGWSSSHGSRQSGLCVECPRGADCSGAGVTYDNMLTLVGEAERERERERERESLCVRPFPRSPGGGARIARRWSSTSVCAPTFAWAAPTRPARRTTRKLAAVRAPELWTIFFFFPSPPPPPPPFSFEWNV